MRKIEFRRGIVWLGEIPDHVILAGQEIVTNYPVKYEIETRIEKVKNSSDRPLNAALKLFWATGGRGCWGFLGARFQPLSNLVCAIHVGVSADETGLLPGLAQAVNEQAKKSIVERDSPLAGILQFDRAVSHPSDSNPRLFRLIADCLIQILESNNEALSDQSLTALLKHNCQSW